MERYRLKNIIILILLLMNSFLFSGIIYRESQESSLLRRSEEELIQLFADSGMTLDPDAISWETPPAGISISRSNELERSAARFLLGTNLHITQQGSATAYSSSSGTVLFRAGCIFEASGTLAEKDGEGFCRSFCKTFSYEEPQFALNEEGSGTASAVFRYEKRPVYNATVTFTLEQDRVIHISGTLLPTSGTALSSDKTPLSAAAALTAFQQMRQEESTVASSILQTKLCYEMVSSPSATLTLGSAWCIVTDIAKYYVNSSTGAITVG